MMTVCAILYASPVPTVKLFDPAPINKEVVELVKYLSPSRPAVPEDADVPAVPAVPVNPLDAEVPELALVPAVAS